MRASKNYHLDCLREFRRFGPAIRRTPHPNAFSRGDLAAVAQGFGLKGARVNTMARFESLFREHQEAGGTTLWDVHIDDLIPSRQFRRVRYGEP